MGKTRITALVLSVIMVITLLAGCSFNPGEEDMSEYVNLYDISKIDYKLAEQLYSEYRKKNSLTTKSIKLSIGDIVDYYITTEIVEGTGESATYTRVEDMCYDTDGNSFKGYKIGESKDNYLFDYGLRWKVDDTSKETQEHRNAPLGTAFSFVSSYEDSYPNASLAGKNVRYTVLLTRVYPTGEKMSDIDTYDYADSSIYTNVESFFRCYESNKETVEIGDWVIISFKGTISGTEFEGGSDDNYGLQVGNGYLFNRFETSLLGHKAGDIFDVSLTIPYSYSDERIAGKDAVFSVEIKAIYDADKTVRENTDYANLYELKEGLRISNYVKYEIMTYVSDNSSIIKYPEKMLTLYNKICRETIETNIAYVENYYKANGMAYSRNEVLVAMYGTTDLESYIDEQSKKEVLRILTGYAVLQKLGLKYTDEDYKRDLTNQTTAMNFTNGTEYTEQEVEKTYNKDRLRGYFVIDVCSSAIWSRIDAPDIPQKQ